MSNPFGGFVHTSPVSSLPHDPLFSLSSNIIRDYFGPTAQTVADCLLSRCCTGGVNDPSSSSNSFSVMHDESPGFSLNDIETNIKRLCKRILNEEREKLVKDVNNNKDHLMLRLNHRNVTIRMAKGPESSGYVVDQKSIRAALLVLVQHSIVAVVPDETKKDKKKELTSGAMDPPKKTHHDTYRYKFNPNRARLIPRYPRYIEHAKDAIDENAGAVVEEILLHGRMRAEDVLSATTESVYNFLAAARDDEEEEEEEEEEEDSEKQEEIRKQKQIMQETEKAEIRFGVLKSFKKLVDGGYLEKVEPIEPPPPPTPSIYDTNKKRKRIMIDDKEGHTEEETSDNELEPDLLPLEGLPLDDIKTLELLRKYPYSRTFSPGSVWRVNVSMFHDILRALVLGNLVKERYEDKVPAAGSIITAALKLVAFKEHAPNLFILSQAQKQRRDEEKGVFTAEELMDYIPTPVLHAFKNKAGGGKSNIHMSLVNLSQVDFWPQVVMEVEGGRFELSTRQMVKYMQGRILHKVVKDDMGDVAARICSLLETKGYLETDHIAKAAMVPTQEAREVVHKLFRTKYISYLNLNQSKQYNSNTSIYLWTVERIRLTQTVITNVCTAYLNLRLRRQHEMAVGKDWIERAKEAGAADENDHEEDKINYQKFCEGLLRLDTYLLQLDESIMVLRDF